MKSRVVIARLLAVITLVAVTLVAPMQLRAQEARPQPFPDPLLDNPFAAFIESYQFAAAHGATSEWRKMEGVAVDAVNKRLYYAITAIDHGMSDSKGDIQMAANPCGLVLMAQLDSQWNITSLSPVVVGGPYNASDPDYPCNKDSIANPDNLFVDGKGNLWIGEDTDFHKNQFLWMWDGKALKRFGVWPAGAEVTGLRVEPNGTLFTNVQHPSPMNMHPFNRGVVGVVTGYKAGDDFSSVAIPTGDDLHKVTLAAGAYQILARVGDAIPDSMGQLFGEIPTADGSVMMRCNNPDGNMFLPTNSTGTEGYLYSNYECTPGGVGRVYIRQGSGGQWQVIEGDMVDFSGVRGTWNNCNASVSPWNTALSTEEYPADVEGEWTGGWLPAYDSMQKYLGTATTPNPYDYGYTVELTPAGGEDAPLGTTVQKHYAMGRFSKEMALAMPDQATVYFGDDGTDRILFKFVAATPGDLSDGTLYAAKVTQDGDALNLKWIRLGSGSDSQIETAIRALDVQPKPQAQAATE